MTFEKWLDEITTWIIVMTIFSLILLLIFLLVLSMLPSDIREGIIILLN